MDGTENDNTSLRREERRILAYLQDLSPNEITPAVVNCLASDIEDLMEMEDDEELSEIGKKRAKLEVGTGFAGDLVELQWRSSNQCMNLAVGEALNEVLYRKVCTQKKKRTSLMAQRETYFYKVASKKHIVELPSPSQGQQLQERVTTVTGDDQGHLSVLRDLGRPSVGGVAHDAPLLSLSPRQTLAHPEQPAAIPRPLTPAGLEVPMTSISAYSVPLIPGPPEDSSVEGPLVLVPPISHSEQEAAEKSHATAIPTETPSRVDGDAAIVSQPIRPRVDQEAAVAFKSHPVQPRVDEDPATGGPTRAANADTAGRTFRTPVSVIEEEIRSPLRAPRSQPAFLAEGPSPPSVALTPSAQALQNVERVPETPARVIPASLIGQGAVIPETPSPTIERPLAVAVPHTPAVTSSAQVPVVQANIPSSDNQLILEEIRPSQISARRSVGRRGMGGLIIDQEIIIRDYAPRAIHLTNKGDTNRSRLDITTVVAKRYRHAMSAARLFLTPACSHMFNPVRGKSLSTMFERNLVTEVQVQPTVCRVSATVPTVSTPQVIPPQLQDLPVVPSTQKDAQPVGRRDSTISGLSITLDETLARCRYEAEIAPVIVQPVSPVGRTDPPLEIIAEVVPKSVLPLHVQSAARGTAPENRNLETPQPPEVQLVVQPVLEMESVAPAVDDAIQHRPVVEPFEKEAAPFVTADVGRPADTVANNSVTATLEVAVSTTAQGIIQPTKQIEEIVLPKQVQGIRESALPVGPNSVQLQPETVAPAVIITTTVPAVPEHIMTNIPTVPQHIMAASDDVATVTAPPQNVVTDELIPVAAPSQNLMAAVDEVILMAAANVIPVTPTVDINALRGAQQRDGQIPQWTPAPTTPAHDRRQIADPEPVVPRMGDSFRQQIRPPPRKELKNSKYVLDTMKALWSIHDDVPVADILGPDATKSDHVALVATLLRLNEKWLVRLYKKHDSLWVTAFSEEHIQKLREDGHLAAQSA